MDSQARRGRLGRPKLALVALALLAVPSVAFAAVVKGKTQNGSKLLNPSWNEAKNPKLHRYTFREPSATVRSDVWTLTGFLPKELCIAALGDEAKPDKRPMRVVVAGGRTTPVTLVIAPGQAIQFENHDPFAHTLYDVGNKGLQPTETAKGKQRTWTPPGPGKYEVRDKATPSLRSWIVVEPKAVAVGYPINRAGDFALELEPGHYTLRGYFNGEAVGKELEIDVRPKPAEQELRNPLVLGEPPEKSSKDKGDKDKGAKEQD
jgi:plastocyanin